MCTFAGCLPDCRYCRGRQRHNAEVHVAARSIAEVETGQRERALGVPVGRGQEERRVEVPTVLSFPFENQRRQPVVVLPGRLAVHDRPGDDDVVFPLAHPPDGREKDVHVELQGSAAVVEKAVESFGVLRLRNAVEHLRGVVHPARVFEEERRQKAEAVVAATLFVIGKPFRPIERPLRRRRPRRPIGADGRADLRRDGQRVRRRYDVRLGAHVRVVDFLFLFRGRPLRLLLLLRRRLRAPTSTPTELGLGCPRCRHDDSNDRPPQRPHVFSLSVGGRESTLREAATRRSTTIRRA